LNDGATLSRAAISFIRYSNMPTPRLVSIHAGKVAPLGPDGVPSAFVKRVLQGSAGIQPLGVLGDQQADLTVHGGPDKAVYGYSFENYADWVRDFPQHTTALVPGAFGENFCITGLRESDLCVGDLHRVGSCELQVCQPREPCFKLALHFSDKMMPKAMIRSGRAGWYYRVITPGAASAGDSVELVGRPNPDFPFQRLVELIGSSQPTYSELLRLKDMTGLAENWRAWAARTLT
jgi:MOSC domain-containing protein YiiM